jgi:HK97 family phage prohead protease
MNQRALINRDLSRPARRAVPAVDVGESRDDFMDRCITQVMDEDGLGQDDAQEVCAIAWEEDNDDLNEDAARPTTTKGAIVKDTVAPVHDMEFTLSDETPDRYGDIVSAAGWELANFKRNPIALFGHDYHFPIGRWADLHIDKEAKGLRGKLQMAPKGTSARIDEIRTLIEHDILRAVSVGFRPTATPESLKDKDGKDTGGVRFLRQELLECSVVPIPANPNALAIAKALNVSSDTLKLVFAESGNQRQRPRARTLAGEFAAPPRATRATAMSLQQRIQDAEQRLNGKRDQLTEHLRNLDDANPRESDDEITTELTRQIGDDERHLGTLKEAELAISPGSRNSDPEVDPASRGRSLVVTDPSSGRPARQVAIKRLDGSTRVTVPSARSQSLRRKKELDTVDYIVRNGVITLMAHRLKKSPDEVRVMIYGQDEQTKAAYYGIQKAATTPAMTDQEFWAQELVTTINGEYMSPLMPTAIYPLLAGRGMSMDFGRNGRIGIPTRSRSRSLAGAFVGEGQPIPVKQGMFETQFLTPKKLGVITVMTREIEQYSTPAIEGLLREAISEDTGESIDSILLDANPDTVVRPPGLRNGVTPLEGTTAAAVPNVLDRMLLDARRLRAELIGSTFGNVRAPVWILHPTTADKIAMSTATGSGVFPFKDEIAAGSFWNWPVLETTIIDPDELMAVDAADFVTVGAGAPTFEVSDQATLHMEDTNPLPIIGGTTAAPVPAVPTRSLWQTDSYALRMLYRLNWALRRDGMVAWMQNITW